LVDRGEDWPWSSLRWLSNPEHAPVRLEPGTVPRASHWVDGVNESSTDPEAERLRECIRRDRPFGSANWTIATAQRLGLESSLRSRGRTNGPGSDQTFPSVDNEPARPV
jgi:putative transposase